MSAIVNRLREVGKIAVESITEPCGLVWHPANELLTAADRMEILEHEVAALKADAKRYRYLRSADRRECLTNYGPEAGCWIDCEDSAGNLILLTGADADAAIDAAIDASKDMP